MSVRVAMQYTGTAGRVRTACRGIPGLTARRTLPALSTGSCTCREVDDDRERLAGRPGSAMTAVLDECRGCEAIFAGCESGVPVRWAAARGLRRQPVSSCGNGSKAEEGLRPGGRLQLNCRDECRPKRADGFGAIGRRTRWQRNQLAEPSKARVFTTGP